MSINYVALVCPSLHYLKIQNLTIQCDEQSLEEIGAIRRRIIQETAPWARTVGMLYTALYCDHIEAISFVPSRVGTGPQIHFVCKKAPEHPLSFAFFIHEREIEVSSWEIEQNSIEERTEEFIPEDLVSAVESILFDFSKEEENSEIALTIKFQKERFIYHWKKV